MIFREQVFFSDNYVTVCHVQSHGLYDRMCCQDDNLFSISDNTAGSSLFMISQLTVTTVVVFAASCLQVNDVLTHNVRIVPAVLAYFHACVCLFQK